MSCGVDSRHGLDPALLLLWCRPVAGALIQLLAWELPYAAGVALKKIIIIIECILNCNLWGIIYEYK